MSAYFEIETTAESRERLRGHHLVLEAGTSAVGVVSQSLSYLRVTETLAVAQLLGPQYWVLEQPNLAMEIQEVLKICCFPSQLGKPGNSDSDVSHEISSCGINQPVCIGEREDQTSEKPMILLLPCTFSMGCYQKGTPTFEAGLPTAIRQSLGAPYSDDSNLKQVAIETNQHIAFMGFYPATLIQLLRESHS